MSDVLSGKKLQNSVDIIMGVQEGGRICMPVADSY